MALLDFTSVHKMHTMAKMQTEKIKRKFDLEASLHNMKVYKIPFLGKTLQQAFLRKAANGYPNTLIDQKRL